MNQVFTHIFVGLMFILSISQSGFCQKTRIENVGKQYLSGVKAAGSEGYYVVYRPKDKSGFDYELALLDSDLKVKIITPLKVDKKKSLHLSQFNGHHYVLVFSTLDGGDHTLVTVDASGKVTKILESENKNKQVPAFYNTADSSGFYKSEYIKDKYYWGYKISRLDSKLNPLWENQFTVKKGKIHLLDIESNKENIIILEFDESNYASTQGNVYIRILNAKTGKQEGLTALSDHELFTPTCMKIESDNTVVTVGCYFQGKNLVNASTQGIGFVRTDNKGSIITKHLYPWSEMAEYLKLYKTFLNEFLPRVFFHHISKTKTGYQVIGEVYKADLRANEKGIYSWQIKVYDYFIIEFSDQGEFRQVQYIEKKTSQMTIPEAYIPNSLVEGHVLKYFDGFSYDFIQAGENPEEEVLVYAIREKTENGKEPVLHTSVIKPGAIEDISTSIEINLRTPFLRMTKLSGAVAGPKGKILLYEYENDTEILNIWYHHISE